MATAAPMPSTGWRHRAVAVHTHTLVLGLSLLSGALLFMLTAGLASGLSLSDGAFLVPFILASAAGAVLAYRFGTWGRAVGMVLGIGAFVMTFFFIFGIFEPASFVEFTGGVAFLLGILLTLYGGIASLVRRDDVRAETPRTERLLDRTALGIVILAFVVSLPLWLVNRSTVDASAAAGLPEVTATNFAFEDVTAAAGGSLVVVNEDPFMHTFTVDALGIDVKLLPGDSTIVELPDAAGTYTYYCIPHSFEAGEAEDDMAATLTLE